MSLSALTVLAQALIAAAPRTLPALSKRTLAKLRGLVQSAQAAQVTRLRQSGQPPENRLAVDVRADRAVRFICQRLEHYAQLVEDEFPRAPRAAELGSMLFPDGLGFLILPYVEQLAVMETLLTRIDEDKLAADLQYMCGDDLVANLRTSIARYRDMVQDSLQKVDETEDLQEYRRKLNAAIVSYATKIAALYDEDDEPSQERVRQALRPIDAMRAQLTQRSGAPDAPPDEPTPPAAPTADPAPATP